MENTAKKIIPISIALFFIVFLIGYTLFSRLGPALTPQASVAPSVLPSSSPVDQYLTPTPTVKQLSAEEKQVLVLPGPKATLAQRKQHDDLIARLAQTADTLDITGCVPNPVVLRVPLNGAFKIRNTDVSTSHTIPLGPNKITVGPKETKTIKSYTAFWGAGNYPYTCDSSQGISGIFVVTP